MHRPMQAMGVVEAAVAATEWRSNMALHSDAPRPLRALGAGEHRR